jgi:hypothetical protein
MLRYWRKSTFFLGLWAMSAFSQGMDPYLALGDSIPFGLNVLLLPPAPKPAPSQFIGYPEVMKDLSLRIRTMTNASCPGETSASFLDSTVVDNGCNSPHVELGFPDVPAFKAPDGIGLHVPYQGSQARFAVSYLLANRNTKLVTLSIGGSDLLLLQLQCAKDLGCMQARLPGMLGDYGANLTQILTAIRVQGRFSGKLVLVKYYSPTVDPQLTQVVAMLNSVMEQVGSQFGAKFADGFAAFRLASLPFQGDPCKAGLVTRLSPTLCDVHPTLYGQRILALTTLLTASLN